MPVESAQDVWRPSADIYVTPAGWLVKFDLAGVRPEDVSLSVAGRSLTVRGRRRDRALEQGHRHHVMEISYCEFERRVELPEELDPRAVRTEHRDGMFLIRVERTQQPER